MIAIIPARGGSKGLPGKNIKSLLGQPLINYTIKAALAAEHITDIIISTDDKETYRLAVECGCKATFLRPLELAEDKSLAVDNYIFTIDKLNADFDYAIDDFVVLQPTSPLRESKDIDAAIEIFRSNNADSVISYTEEAHPISWHKKITKDGLFENILEETLDNRQAYEPSYYPNGAIYVFKYEIIKQRKYYTDKSYAYIMPTERSVDIDTINDFMYTEYLLRKRSE